MRVWITSFGLALALAGCGVGAEECSYRRPCVQADQLCVEGLCLARECTERADCPYEHVCVQGECSGGCEDDHDCYPGDSCTDEGVCAPATCTDTQRDCSFREVCDLDAGECLDAGDLYCRPCTRESVVEDCNDGDSAGTNRCWRDHCAVDCTEDRLCPAGFECLPLHDQEGEVESWQCLTDCDIYQESRGA